MNNNTGSCSDSHDRSQTTPSDRQLSDKEIVGERNERISPEVGAKCRRHSLRGFLKLGLVGKALGITLLALLLSKCLTAPFTASTSAIFALPDKSDFILPDLFAQVADSRPVRQFDDRIVVIDIGDDGRDEIAALLETLALCSPAAVGLDVNFADAREDDSRLIRAIAMHPGIVLPLGVESADMKACGDDSEKFSVSDTPFFYGRLQGPDYGVVNFPSKDAKATIREMPLGFPMSDGRELPSFAMLLARKVAPDAVEALKKRGNQREYISFHSKEYTVMPSSAVADRAEEIVGKIVLIGACGDISDMHPTPVDASMPGILIHAGAISTLLDDAWLSPLPEYVDDIAAMVICFIIVIATIGIRSGVRGLIIRIMQILAAYLAVRIGYGLYVDHNIVCNLSHTLLMIAFGLFAVDIWNGGATLGGIAIGKTKQFINRYKRNLTCEE